MRNYLRGTNPFALAGPPDWWLCKLWDFDDSLVIVPSKQGCFYRLAQRRRPTLGAAVATEVLKDEGDTLLLASHHLVPITTLSALANWSNPLMWEDLRQMAPWRHPQGADAFIKDVEALDVQKDAATQAKIDNITESLAKDSWGYYRMKAGLQTRMWSPRTASPKSPAASAAIRTQPKTLNAPRSDGRIVLL
jgi:hypothetical protein